MSTLRHRAPGRRVLRVVAATLALAVLASGCGNEPDQPASDIVADAQARDVRQQQLEQQRVEARNQSLPGFTTGVVKIDGNAGSLTPDEVFDYNNTGTSDSVQVAYNGEDRAFQELCAGQIDLVDSSRTISRAEWEACQAVGLDVVQFQIASDAVVVAIKSETDVGGDCLSTDQVREIFRAGSPISRWNQVGAGYDDIPLRTGGPDARGAALRFFESAVLGGTEASLADIRSDYRAFDTDQGTRMWVVGDARDETRALDLKYRSQKRAQLQDQVAVQRQVVADALNERRVAAKEVAKGIRTKRPPAQQARDRAREEAAVAALNEARAKLRRVQAHLERVTGVYRRSATARDEVMATRGRVAIFGFSYYELFEEQLRPFEITLPSGQMNCIFPSTRTVTSGEYPLARRLLITTTTRSLARGEVSDFLKHYLANAQDLATKARLVPLPDDVLRSERNWLTGREEPTLVAVNSRNSAGQVSEPTTGVLPAR